MLGSLFEKVDKKIELICKETKNVKQLRALLKRNKHVNLNMLDFDGWSVVHLAVIGGSAELVEFLIKETNANPIKKCNDNMVTPLHTAAWRGSHDIVRVLLMHPDVKINELSKDGQTALHYAAWSGMIHACRTLLAKNADTLVRNNDGFTPLLIAARCNQIAVFSVLLEAALTLIKSSGVGDNGDDNNQSSVHPVNDPVHSDANGCFALHHACYEGHDDLVRYLLQLGADKSQSDSLGRTPLDMCVNDSTRRIVEGPMEDETASVAAPSVQSVKPDVPQAMKTPPRGIGSRAASTFRDKHSQPVRDDAVNDAASVGDDNEGTHEAGIEDSHTPETDGKHPEWSESKHTPETGSSPGVEERTDATADTAAEHGSQPTPKDVAQDTVSSTVIRPEEYLQAANALHAKETISRIWDLCSAPYVAIANHPAASLTHTPIMDSPETGSVPVVSDESRALQLQDLLAEHPTVPLNSLRDSNYQTLLIKACGRHGNPSAIPVLLAYQQHVCPSPAQTATPVHHMDTTGARQTPTMLSSESIGLAAANASAILQDADSAPSAEIPASDEATAAGPSTEVRPGGQQMEVIIPCAIFATDSHNRTALQHAVVCGNNDAISLLLKHLSTNTARGNLVQYIEHRNDQGCNAIHIACEHGHLESLTLMLSLAAEASGSLSAVNVNAKDRDGFTPLHYACKYSHLAVVQFLVTETKAQIMSFNLSGELPADVTKNSIVVRFLQATTQYRASLNPATVCTVHAKIKMKNAYEEALKGLTAAADALMSTETSSGDPKTDAAEPAGGPSRRPVLQRARTFTRDTSPLKSTKTVRIMPNDTTSESTPPHLPVTPVLSANESVEKVAPESGQHHDSPESRKKQSIYAFPSVVIRGSSGEVTTKQGHTAAMDKFMNLGATAVEDSKSETDSSCCGASQGKDTMSPGQRAISQSPIVVETARVLSPIQQRDAKVFRAQALSEKSAKITSRADPRDSSTVFKELYKSMVMEAKQELLGKGAAREPVQRVGSATPANVDKTTPATALPKQSTRSQSNPHTRRPPAERSISTNRSAARPTEAPVAPTAAVRPTGAPTTGKVSKPVKQATAPASPQKDLMERMRARERKRHSFSSTVPLSNAAKSTVNNPNKLYSKQLGQQESVFTRLSARPAAAVIPAAVIEPKSQSKRPTVSKRTSAEESRLMSHFKSIDKDRAQSYQQHQRLAEHNRTYSIDNQDNNVVLNTSYLAPTAETPEQPISSLATGDAQGSSATVELSNSRKPALVSVTAVDAPESAPLRRRSSLSMFTSMFPVFGSSSANLKSPASSSQMAKKTPLPVQGYTQQSLLSDSPLNTEYVELQVFIGTLNRILDLHVNGLKKLFYRWKHYRGDNINNIVNNRMMHVSPHATGRSNGSGTNSRKPFQTSGISPQSQRDLYDDSHVVRATVTPPTTGHMNTRASRGMSPKQRQLLWPNVDEPPPPPPPLNQATPQGLSLDPTLVPSPQHHPEGSPWHASISDLSSSTTPEQPSAGKRADNTNGRLVSARVRSAIGTPQGKRLQMTSESIQRLHDAMEPLIKANETALRTIYNHFSSDKRPLKPTKQAQPLPTDRSRMSEYDLWTLLMTFGVCPDVCSRSQLSDLVQSVCPRVDAQASPTQDVPSSQGGQRRSSVTPTRRSSMSRAPSSAGPISRRSSVSGTPTAGDDQVDSGALISFLSFTKVLCLLSELCHSSGRQNPAGAEPVDPLKQLAMLLYLMDSSEGRHKIASGASRAAKVMPAFVYTGVLISSGSGKR